MQNNFIYEKQLKILPGNRKIFDTDHAIKRFMDARGVPETMSSDFFMRKVLKIVEEASKIIISKHKDISNIYGIHSKSTGIGVIIHWRKDTQNWADKQNHAFIVTVLPIKRFHNFKREDIPIMVETLCIEWTSLINKNIYEDVKKDSKGDVSTFRKDNFVVVFYEGKFHDSTLVKEKLIIVN